MIEFIQAQFMFFFAIALVLFLPGYLFLLAFFGKTTLNILERFIIATGLSVLITDFIMLLMSRFNISFTRTSLIIAILTFSLGCFFTYKKRFEKAPLNVENKLAFNFSSKQLFLIILILFLSIFIRSAYLQNSLPPSSTDLGHHMYWSKLFAESGEIQNYTQRDIVNVAGTYQSDSPRPISDFVIGEHLIFSAIGLISGASFISSFPVLILLFINIFSLLATFILSLQLFKDSPQNKNMAIFGLLILGALFAIDPPQAKFVGGGVVGNIIGNLLIPLAFYFYIRFIREKELLFVFFALVFSMGLFYTHHLSALIFLLVFAGFIVLSLALNFRETKNFIFSQKKNLFSPLLISFFIFAISFVFVIYTPTYLKNSAVNTVVGSIKKVEHTGLSLLQFRNILGETRFATGIFGFILFLFYYKKNPFRFSSLLLISWVAAITLISLAPNLVGISIPSGRVANYGVYPFALLGAFSFISLFDREKFSKKHRTLSGQMLIFSAFSAMLIFIFANGFEGNSDFLRKNSNNQNVQLTLETGRYLASKMEPSDLLASDHVYLFADSWIKLFFMRDYYFPSYRANFERYENGVDKHEFCTRDMISSPGGELGRKCFEDLGTNFVMVDKLNDSMQFQKLNNFWQVYSNDKINVYYRKN